MLSETPIALPAIYILAGIEPAEACVIERLPDEAHVIGGPGCAANAWQSPAWSGRSRGEDNAERIASMSIAEPSGWRIRVAPAAYPQSKDAARVHRRRV